jgi:hypothetical protein
MAASKGEILDLARSIGGEDGFLFSGRSDGNPSATWHS